MVWHQVLQLLALEERLTLQLTVPVQRDSRVTFIGPQLRLLVTLHMHILGTSEQQILTLRSRTQQRVFAFVLYALLETHLFRLMQHFLLWRFPLALFRQLLLAQQIHTLPPLPMPHLQSPLPQREIKRMQRFRCVLTQVHIRR